MDPHWPGAAPMVSSDEEWASNVQMSHYPYTTEMRNYDMSYLPGPSFHNEAQYASNSQIRAPYNEGRPHMNFMANPQAVGPMAELARPQHGEMKSHRSGQGRQGQSGDSNGLEHGQSSNLPPDHNYDTPSGTGPAISTMKSQPNAVRSDEREGQDKVNPDLTNLKARVIASLSRSRNSSTPNREPTPGAKPIKSDSETTIELERATDKKQSVASSSRKDPLTDIDGLLAEGKALADASTKRSPAASRSMNSEQSKTMRGQSDISAHANRETHDEIVGDGQEAKKNKALGDKTQTSPPSRRLSSGSSEQGEIREDRDEPSQVSRQHADRESRTLTEKSGMVLSSSEAEKRRPSLSNKGKPHSTTAVLKSRHGNEPGQGTRPLATSSTKTDERTSSARLKPSSDYIRSHSGDTTFARDHRLEERARPRRQEENGLYPSSEIPDPQPGGEAGREVTEYQGKASRRVIDLDDSEGSRRLQEAKPPGRNVDIELPRYVDDRLRITAVNASSAPNSDLQDWLDMTGYYDRAYRKEALQRHREIVALDMKRAELARDAHIAQEQRAYLTRPQYVFPDEGYDLNMSRLGPPARNSRSASDSAMPPPPAPASQDRFILERRARQELARDAEGYPESRRSSTIRHSSVGLLGARTVDPQPSPHPSSGTLKRRFIADDDMEELTPDKLVRVDQHGRAFDRPLNITEGRSSQFPSKTGNRQITETGYGQARRVTEVRLSPPEAMDIDSRPRATPARMIQSSPMPRGEGHRSRSPSAMRGRVSDDQGMHPPLRGRHEESQRPRLGTPPLGPAYQGRNSTPPRRPCGELGQSHAGRPEHRNDEGPPRARGEIVRPSFSDRPQYEHSKFAYAGRGRGRGGHYNQRGGGRMADYPSRDSAQGPDRQRLDLHNGDTRFFIVKSYNSENVEKAIEDNVWATQEKNSEIFEEAFHTSRHVILIFSVNMSKAFQGYARMESVPGTAQTPPWAKGLLWKSSGPFRLRWITIADTRFSRVGHLKNPYNEHQAVLIARDGQEVEEKCGAALCDLIDEEADRIR